VGSLAREGDEGLKKKSIAASRKIVSRGEVEEKNLRLCNAGRKAAAFYNRVERREKVPQIDERKSPSTVTGLRLKSIVSGGKDKGRGTFVNRKIPDWATVARMGSSKRSGNVEKKPFRDRYGKAPS